jgi:phosphate:Na+ symporter
LIRIACSKREPSIATYASIELGTLVTGLGGGLALFLFGMRQMTESLKLVAGSSMKNLLAKLTANRFTAALAGAIITAVIQSSSVTTVLIVGFISAGLLNLGQSIGVIIGANIGTTITAQIIAFSVAKYGLMIVAIGFMIDVISKNEKTKQWGMVLMGLGLVFFGMELMSNATGPLRQWPPFINAMQSMHSPLLSIVIGLVFTAIVQSSSATTGMVIVLASQGLVPLESGIGLVFGANIGTCVTAILSSLGRPREAMQAAWAHVLFNVIGVLLWMFFIPQFAEFIRMVSPSANALDGAAKLAAETPRQIANAHTLFNVGNALIFIWFTGPLAQLVHWLVPARAGIDGIRPIYLHEIYLDQPAMALDQVRRELVRLAELDREMLVQAFRTVTVGTQQDIDRVRKLDTEVDELYGSIILYLGRLSQKNLVHPQPKQLSDFIAIANYLENFGDVIESNILVDAAKRLRRGVAVSPETISALKTVHDKVCWSFERAMEAIRNHDQDAAADAVKSKAEVNQLAEAATTHLSKRLVAYEPDRLAAFKLETNIMENLQRINTLSRRIGKALRTHETSTVTEDAPAS